MLGRYGGLLLGFFCDPGDSLDQGCCLRGLVTSESPILAVTDTVPQIVQRVIEILIVKVGSCSFRVH